ncbi:MAG TPA: hypothetical protein VG826_09005 [Pirellulales bacterium]|nr:hypothetical protein [Pirellulales bacterium]
MSAAGKSRGFQRHSWKGGGKGDVDPRAARRVRRVVGTLAALCLFAWFAWLLWPHPVATTYVLCAAVDDYDVLQAPPLPFAGETISEFEPLAKRSGISFEHRQDVKTAKGLADLFAGELPRGQPQNADIVLVYLAAHGVSQSDGQGGARAWLLGSDYGAMRDVGKVAIDDVLSALRDCQARTKVLVLDAGSIENDPALGMAVNEFPTLVAEKVSQLPGDDVWVLLSHRLFEKSHAAFADRRSVFGYFVARGLQGGKEVDRDADGVDLAELFDYVRDNVARYVWHASDRQETQTPVLLGRRDLGRARGLKLTLRAPAELAEAPAEETPADKSEAKPEKKVGRLIPGARWSGLAMAGESAAPAREKSATEKPATDKPPAAPQGEAASANSAPADVDAEPKTGKGSDSPASDGAAGEQAPAEKSDKAPAKEGSGPSSQAEAEKAAVDPDLAALGDEWHACELLCARSSLRWTPVDYAPRAWLRHVEQLKGYELRWLFGASSSARRIGQGGDEADWNVLRRRFDDSVAKPAFEQHPALEAAVQLRNDLLFSLRYYAAWSVGEGSTEDCMRLSGQLARLLDVLSRPPAPPVGGGQAVSASQWLAELAALRDEIEIEKERFDERIGRAVRDCLESKSASSLKIQRLLRLPWIAANDRAKLVARLQASPRLEAELPPPPSAAQGEQRERQLEQDAARRAGWLAHLQWRLLQLAGSQEFGKGDQVDEKLSRLDQSSRFDAAAARDVGFALAEAYQRLNRELTGASVEAFPSTDDLQAIRLVENRARLADVRNKVDLADKFFWEIPFPALAIDWKPNLVAVPLTQGTSEDPLRTDADSEVSWRIGNAPPGPVEVSWSVEYDADLIAVAGRTKGTLNLRPGGSETERTLTFLVRAKGDQREASTASLTLHVESPSASPQTGQIAVTLPKWQPIELSVVETDKLQRPNFKADERGIKKVVLMPLPSGKTLFHIELRNPSPRERKIKYQLLALSKTGLSARPLGLWPLRPGGEWQPYAKAVQPAPVELTLPANSKTRLSFPPFPKPPAPETPEPTPSTKTEAPTPEVATGLPVGDGLICEVTDLSTDLPGAQQRFWIDVVPLHPRYYVIPTVRYNAQSRRIELIIKPRFPGRLPPEGSTVRWYSEGLEDDLNPIGGVLTADQRELSLPSPPIDASKIPKNQAVHVLVDIDGYPRAFRYDVRCDRPSGDASETELADLQFLNPPSTPPTWLKNSMPIGVKIRADGPRGWFEEPGHFIEVGIHGDPRQTVAFDSDRRCDVLLLPAENDGDFLVETRVDDLQAQFRSDAYPDQEISLVASLGSTADERTVGLDGNSPLIKALTPRPIYEGNDMLLSVVVTDDRSGLDKVEAAVDADDSGEVKQWQWASEDDRSPGTYTVKLPTKALSPRRWTALVQAKDLAGNTTVVERVRFEVVPKPAPGAGGPKKNTTRVDATVTFNSRAAPNFRGKFTGPKTGSVQADREGRFSVELPPGGYKFEFEGVVNNTKVKFIQELTVDPPGDKPQRATLAGP